MASLNQCQFIGNVGRAPEVRYSPSGDAICNFSVAVNESWKDKSTGEKRESTEWVRVVAYRRLGEICGEYLKSGAPVWIQGKLKTRKWQDKDTGADRYSTEIVADQMQMLGGREEASGSAPQQRAALPQRQDRPAAPQAGPAANLADMDDDIPF
jgi:single-strand DNA-binding protein